MGTSLRLINQYETKQYHGQMAHGCLLFPCPSLISCQALSSGIRETKSPQDECHEGRGGLGALRVLNGNMLLHRLVVV